MSATNKDLDTVLQHQANRVNDPELDDNVWNEIKQSMLFSINWQDLLGSAPAAIYATGLCYVAAFSEAGLQIQLTQPVTPFKYLQFRSLTANLVACGDQGNKAFGLAQANMGSIKTMTFDAERRVQNIIGILRTFDSANNRDLQLEMQALGSAAKGCKQFALEVDVGFEKWLDFANELYAACIGTDSTEEEKLQATNISLAVEQSKISGQEIAVNDAKQLRDKLGKQLDIASAAYQKASDNFPSGWDLVGQDVVTSLTHCATAALTQFATAYASTINPMTMVDMGSNDIEGIIWGPPKDGKSSVPPYAHTSIDATYSPPNVAHPNDPAYPNIIKDMPYLDALQSLLTSGPGNGVDWDTAVSGNANQTIGFVADMLENASTSFVPIATTAPPSQNLKTILANATDIASAVHKVAAGADKITSKLPQAGDQQVMAWQTLMKSQYSTAQTLFATAKSIPGSTAAGTPLITQTAQPAAPSSDQPSLAQSILTGAENRLTTTQQCFVESQKTYAQNAALLVQQQSKLAVMQGELAGLLKQKMGLTAIKSVLSRCIRLILLVKNNISRLCEFFDTIASTIQVTVDYTVTPFLQQVKADTSVGGFTLTDYQRSSIYAAAVTISAYFSVYGSVAIMWDNMSIEHLEPGTIKLNNMSTAASSGNSSMSDQTAKVKDLGDWYHGAVNAVKALVGKTEDQMNQSMGQRIGRIQQTMQQLPPAPAAPVIQKATQNASITVNTSINYNFSKNPVNNTNYSDGGMVG